MYKAARHKITSVFVPIRHRDDCSRKQRGNCVSVINLETVHNVSVWVRPLVLLCTAAAVVRLKENVLTISSGSGRSYVSFFFG